MKEPFIVVLEPRKWCEPQPPRNGLPRVQDKGIANAKGQPL
jgi:hypothetical protein